MAALKLNLKDPERKFNQEELEEIKDRAALMFNLDEVEVYLLIGKHTVCLKRKSKEDKKILVWKMDFSHEVSENIIKQSNKRKAK